MWSKYKAGVIHTSKKRRNRALVIVVRDTEDLKSVPRLRFCVKVNRNDGRRRELYVNNTS